MTSAIARQGVSVVSPADAGKAVATVTLAFAADPVLRWFFPGAKTYVKYFPRVVQAFAGAASDQGSAHSIDCFSGVALWLPPGAHADLEGLGALMEEAIPADRQGEVNALMEQMNASHPAEPHWHLPLLGVDPAKHRRGYGSALLEHGIAIANRAGLPAYLESTSPDNTRLYVRHGFEAIGTVQSGSSPAMTCMIRRPS